MKTLSSPSSLAVRFARRSLCTRSIQHNVPRAGRLLVRDGLSPLSQPKSTQKLGLLNLNSKSLAHYTTAALETNDGEPETSSTPKTTFEDLGLHAPIVKSLQKAFPDVEYPTDVQSVFIPAVLQEKDVFLRDSTGSGKSFGLVLALLNKHRIITQVQGAKMRHITSLVLVPHRDLAYQYLHWIEQMVNASVDGHEPPPLSSVAQVLVRDEGMHLDSGLDLLRRSIESLMPPHILIATPQALMDIHKADNTFIRMHLSPSTLSAVCIDEADYLIETLPRKDPAKSFKKAMDREKKRIERHPGPTKELLNIIYKPRQEANAAGLSIPPCPQLILSSATLRTQLRNYVYGESGWLDRQNVVKIYGAAKKEASQWQRGLQHSILLVSEERVRNMDSAADTPSNLPISAFPTGPSAEPEPPHGNDSTGPEYGQTSSPFNPNMLEAIATTFALDVPLCALLVLPASASVTRAIWELSELGINARSMDLQKKHWEVGSSSEDPVLLVGTLATTRGVDLPELSHVFLYGLPDAKGKVNGQSVDTYLHVAGRVGRFGRGGRVITFVAEDERAYEDGSEEGGKKVSQGEKMERILESINVRAVKYGVFD
ncbi:P-loop containing nucleoside triphosphate hydrolase protein [Coprinopsis marcescibilis]|uniref:ATP-dependent RNA helicase n=1 Tax=Coprinopsis marcescibilis TaxID=230819 RepID=A0A5C3LDN5_COPMA|nr:P-loop containing nucleoside triphosphate hydrolase protein [Coprinopsis marcescibilis]